ncbi:MAG: hypothetical protein MR436_04000 [Eubacterium sp.]|nr:hypothetical protein [Eubacterium sp.]
MREFVNGTDLQYTMLKEMLSDHQCHVYPNCTFPDCCSKSNGRIGFEKEENTYALFIDKGITCSGRNAPALFLEWLSTGTLRFLDFTDMKEFLKSLRCLY